MQPHTAGEVKWRRGEQPRPPRDYVIFDMAGRFTHADIIRKIAERLKLRLGPLPEQLSRFTYDYTPANPFHADGSAGAYLDWLTAMHENLYWSFSDGMLRFETGKPSFSGLLARLMREARKRYGGRIPDAEKHRIAAELDADGFPFLEQFRKGSRYRENQALYNQTNHKKPILTFEQALNTPWAYLSPGQRFSPRRAVLQRFYDAER